MMVTIGQPDIARHLRHTEVRATRKYLLIQYLLLSTPLLAADISRIKAVTMLSNLSCHQRLCWCYFA